MTKKIPLNCHICGRFVGKNGYDDVTYDDYNGGFEIGYSTCAAHTKGITNAILEQSKLPDKEDNNDNL